MTAPHASISPNTLSRSLLVPGPQPPLSHLGATLMRHVVGTVVRYSLYQLGLPMPDGPPVRILRLRVFLDAAPLLATLRTQPAGPEVLAALIFPRAPATSTPTPDACARRRRSIARGSPRWARVAVARRRRRRRRRQSSPRRARRQSPRTREQLWSAVCSLVAGRMPYLCDAALGELVTSLARRRLRHFGKAPGGALGQVALQVHQNRDADLRALGALDPDGAVVGRVGGRHRRRFAIVPGARAAIRRCRPARGGAVAFARRTAGCSRKRDRSWSSSATEASRRGSSMRRTTSSSYRSTWARSSARRVARRGSARRSRPTAASTRRSRASRSMPTRSKGPRRSLRSHERSADWDIAPLLLVE